MAQMSDSMDALKEVMKILNRVCGGMSLTCKKDKGLGNSFCLQTIKVYPWVSAIGS